MASGKITVTNFSEGNIQVNIVGQGTTQQVASGELTTEQSTPFPVEGFDLYQVNFIALTSGGNFPATNISPNTEVSLNITSSSDGGE